MAINTITKTFTYNLPDDYLAQTSELGLTAEWTYEGPEKLFVFVENETGNLLFSQSFIPTDGSEEIEAGAVLRAGLDTTAVLLTPGTNDDHALVASLYHAIDTSRSAGYPQKEYKIDGVTLYERPDPTSPDHTYEPTEFKYNLETGEFVKPYTWKKPWITMEQHVAVRDAILAGAKEDLENGDLSEEVKAKMPEYIEKLEQTYEKFAGWQVHMIPFPDDPRTPQIDGFTW